MKFTTFFRILLLVVLMFQSACFYRKTITDSDLVLKENLSKKSTEQKDISVALPENLKKGELLNQVLSQISAGTYSAENFATKSFEDHAIIELRKKFFDENFKVFVDENSRGLDYIVKINCTEYVPVVQGKDDKSNIPTAQAAGIITIVGSNLGSMAMVLGPVAGGVGAIVPLSGIALGSEEKYINSLITFDVQVIKPSGEIVLAKPYRSTFATKVVTKGNITSSNSKAVASSSVADAIRSAMDLAFVDLKKILN